MAQNLADAEGIVVDDDYPKGVKIVDNETTVNAHINQDIIQFFQKLMRISGTTPNTLDDNEVNGYQFIEALIKSFKYYTSQVPSGLLATLTDAGLSEIATNQEVIDGVDLAVHGLISYPLCIQPSALVNYTGRIKYKILTVTGWDMGTSPFTVVNHGINYATYKILSKEATVISDVDDYIDRDLFDMGNDVSNPSPQGWFGVFNNTSFVIYRKEGGIFDDSAHYDGSFSRVIVKIAYIP